MAQHLTESDFSYLLNIQSEVPNSGNYNDIIVTCHWDTTRRINNDKLRDVS